MPNSALSPSISGMFTLQLVVLDNARHRFITKIYFSFSLQRSIKLSPIHNTNEHYAFTPAYIFSYTSICCCFCFFILLTKSLTKSQEKKNINSKSSYSLTHCVLHSSSASLLLLFFNFFKNSKYLNLKVTEVM